MIEPPHPLSPGDHGDYTVAGYEPRPKPNGKAEEGNGSTASTWRNHIVTAAELQHKTFPQVTEVVPGLIVEGLTILAGKPKLGNMGRTRYLYWRGRPRKEAGARQHHSGQR
jgi:hypothetical protein